MKKHLLLILLFSVLSLHAEEFRFALITDIHMKADDSLAWQDLERTVEHINRTSGLDFVLVTGDLTEEGDRVSLLRVKELLDLLSIPYYALSGNHETKWSESGSTDFAHIYGSERFNFIYKGIHFLGFGTGPVIRMMDGHVAPQDITWLQKELSATSRPAILVTHYPLLPADVDNWYEVTDAVRAFPVKAFLGGHYHQNKQFFYDGIPAFLSRSNLRDPEDGVGGYSIYELTRDSLFVYEQKWNQEPRKWGGYSLKEVYYTKENTNYLRPDFSVNEEYPEIKENWLVSTGSALYASPCLSGDFLYIGDDEGVFSCYSIVDGKREWSFPTGNRIVGTADVAGDQVVFGSADRFIYALNTLDGSLCWKYEAKEPVLGSAKIEDGVVYIGASDQTFRALDLKTGKLKWEYAGVKGYVETRPLVYKNKVIFGAWDNRMYALDKNNGRLCWSWDGGLTRMHFSPAAVWPVATKGKVYFTAPDRVMTALNAETGETVWRTKESMVRETIALSEDQQRVYSKTMQDSVVCYSTLTDHPERIWVTNVGYGYDHAASMPVEKEGVVFGSTKNGIIFALDGKTGELLWKHKVSNSLIGTVCPLNRDECLFTSSSGLIGRLSKKEP
ncbi:MAG: PQQ-binding-like beta-propeller repeat protein [Tannerellaceae bacterium]|nr:PQQ-binding-like beta-propeller repeat protein [Tannerellaceae bacterium]